MENMLRINKKEKKKVLVKDLNHGDTFRVSTNVGNLWMLIPRLNNVNCINIETGDHGLVNNDYTVEYTPGTFYED